MKDRGPLRNTPTFMPSALAMCHRVMTFGICAAQTANVAAIHRERCTSSAWASPAAIPSRLTFCPPSAALAPRTRRDVSRTLAMRQFGDCDIIVNRTGRSLPGREGRPRALIAPAYIDYARKLEAMIKRGAGFRFGCANSAGPGLLPRR